MKRLILIGIALVCNFVLSSQTLKEIAEQKGVNIGAIMSTAFVNNVNHDGGAQNNIVRAEFNALVLENAMKMSEVIPNRPANPFNFGAEALNKGNIDRFISYCKDDIPGEPLLTRGHTIIWYNQAPNWLRNEAPNWTSTQVYEFTFQYIKALTSYCGDGMDEWDVINEVLHDDNNPGVGPFRSGAWYRNAANDQASYDNYFKFCFETAREFAPNAKLFYNDYSIERYNGWNGSKNGRMRDFVSRLVNLGTPIDAVGFQSHFTLDEIVGGGNTVNEGFINGVEQSMQFIDNLGLEVAITELDIRKCNGNGTDAGLKAAFKGVTQMALSQPNCKTLLVWGISDKDSWIPYTFSNCGDALLYNNSYGKKSSYFGVSEALNGLLNIGEFGNLITNVTSPEVITQGEMITVSVNYESAQENDLVLMLQLDSDPYTVFQEERLSVQKGQSTVEFDLTVPLDIPVGQDAYQFQLYLAPVAGGWDDRLADLNKQDVDVKEVEVKEPFLEIIQIPGVLEAEHYDKGGQGVSYNDEDPENKGAANSDFRVTEGVDIVGSVNNYVVGWAGTGEWLEYTVNIQEPGEYYAMFYTASLEGTGMLGLKIDGEVKLTNVTVPSTGDWAVFSSFQENVVLPEGEHVLRLEIEQFGFDIDKVVIEKVVPTAVGGFIDVNGISVFPNPSVTGEYKLSLKKEYAVYSLQGERIITGFSDKVDLSNCLDGVYLLRVGDTTVKLIK